MTTTAVRTWKGQNALITVTFSDGTIRTAGGKRAARAEAVIVMQHTEADEPGIYGVRGDAAKAAAEADKWARGFTGRVQRMRYEVAPRFMSASIPVVEA